MPTPPSTLSSRHVQTIVPEEVHKGLRDIAYKQKTPVKDLIREILTQYVAQHAAAAS